ncbi:MAG: cell division protein FtsL, partial [Desulfobacterales bacterium]|nr:cell division protein FtsL [Desulfobacterales bacterium]
AASCRKTLNPLPQETMQRNLRKTRVHTKPGVWILIMMLFMAELLLYTWCRVQCVRLGYDIAREETRQQDLMALQHTVKIELAHLKSPERIANIAKNQLGLNIPTPEQLIIIP